MSFRPTAISLSKGQKASSRAWISRQFRDPYVKQRLSDPAAYRARSAFKLLEIDSQWDDFLTKPDVRAVVDLGAAPGGWSQVVAGKLGWHPVSPRQPPGERVYGLKGRGTWSSHRKEQDTTFDPLNIEDENVDINSGQRGRGTIIAIDLLRMQPIRGVHTVQGDFLSPEARMLIHGLLAVKGNPEGKVDIILSDMAANSSGNHVRDIESCLEICNAVFKFAQQSLRSAKDIGRQRGGVLLLKHFTHPLLQKFRTEKLVPSFHDVKYIKPDSSRSDSSEGYFLCRGWKGYETYEPFSQIPSQGPKST